MNRPVRKFYRIFGIAILPIMAFMFGLPNLTGHLQTPETPGATFTVTNASDTGAGTLRQAILDANAATGTDTINFAIGTGSVEINLDTTLPTVTDPVVIDGTTQPGFAGSPLIILRRNNAPVATNGLQISGGNSTVRSLALMRFRDGVVLEMAGGNTITGCFLGIDPRNESSTLSGTTGNGILINNSPNNTIGGNSVSLRNVIGRSTSDGIEITGAASIGNIISGNYIGILSNGTDVARNLQNGVFINDSSNNRIGGTALDERNLISGHTDLGQPVDLQAGIQISGTGASGNVVQGNYIGTDATGSSIKPNSFGIWLNGASNNTIGGTTGTTPGGPCTGACNLISGNRREGVAINLNVFAQNAASNVIEGNFFNLNPSGMSLLVAPSPGPGYSISIINGPNTRVGGTSPASRNVIVSTADNVLITNSSGCVVKANFIGTNSTGTSALGNAVAGVTVQTVPGGTGTATSNSIGGTTVGERNLISGGNQTGIILAGTSNTVQGNYIGTDVTGALDLGNAQDGILAGGSFGTIGTATGTTRAGACTGGCNVISGNGRDGVRIQSSLASSNRVDYNYIGLNAEGLEAMSNDGSAINLLNSTNNNIIGKPPGTFPQATEFQRVPEQVFCIQDYVTGDIVSVDDETNEATIMRCNGSLPRTVPVTINVVGVFFSFKSDSSGLSGSIDLDTRLGKAEFPSGSSPQFPSTIFVLDRDVGNSSCVCPTTGDQLLDGGVTLSGTDTIDNFVIGNRLNLDRSYGRLIGSQGIGVSIELASRNEVDSNLIAVGESDAIDASSGNNNDLLFSTIDIPAALYFRSNDIKGVTGPPRSLIDLNDNNIRDPNDPQDPDGGANRTQNYPENLVVQLLGENDVRLTGNFNSTPNGTFDVRLYGQFFAQGSKGQANVRIYPLGTKFQLATNANGDAPIDLMFTSVDAFGIRASDAVLATATVINPIAQAGDTSEFSLPAVVPIGPSPTPTPTASPTLTPTATATPSPTPGSGFENDVTPRPNGDGIVISGDVIQMRRFATGLDSPGVDPNEYQRADSAPRTTFGDGIVNSGDVIQARRYATGLDPQTPAAGPTAPPNVPNLLSAIIGDVYAYLFGRELRVGTVETDTGKTVTVPIEMRPFGDEAAVSFTIEYDASTLSNTRLALADGAPANSILTVNDSQRGRIGILLDSTNAFEASAMPRPFVTVTFDLAHADIGKIPISLTGSLASRGVSDSAGRILTTRYANGGVTVFRKY
ncbi:MAG: hypothetical protein WBO10_04225 [Pyrinomonadaceae bacterium]